MVDEKAGRKERLEKMRAKAEREVDGALLGAPPRLPWPCGSVESLVLWLGSQEAIPAEIGATLPNLTEFATWVDAGSWRPSQPDAMVEEVAPTTTPSPAAAPAVANEPVANSDSERIDVPMARSVIPCVPATGLSVIAVNRKWA